VFWLCEPYDNAADKTVTCDFLQQIEGEMHETRSQEEKMHKPVNLLYLWNLLFLWNDIV
jgi:hypothetical protein